MRAQSAHAAGRPRLWGYELNLEIERVVSLRWRWANEDERLAGGFLATRILRVLVFFS